MEVDATSRRLRRLEHAVRAFSFAFATLERKLAAVDLNLLVALRAFLGDT